MLPSFLITLREVIEASLIVATVIGILIKTEQNKLIPTVWTAAAGALASCFAVLGIASLIGFNLKSFYTGKIEQAVEGVLLIVSGIFITYAVFFLHKQFSGHKVKLLNKINEAMLQEERRGLFALVFTAVLREGIEIVLFLLTVFLSSKPVDVLAGFSGGVIGGVLIAYLLVTFTLRLPVYYAFRVTSAMLILFSAGMFARGAHELIEFGLLPESKTIILGFIPQTSTFAHDLIQSIFGLSHEMTMLQIGIYVLYSAFMFRYVFRKRHVE